MTAVPTWIVPHLPVVFGLAAGTLTEFGQAYEAGRLTLRKVVGQCSMLATLGLIVEMPADFLALAPTPRAIGGAAAALLGARLIGRFRRWADRVGFPQLGVDEPAA